MENQEEIYVMREIASKVRLGHQLAQARHRRGWRLLDVARRTTYRPGRLSEIEHGKANSTIDTLAEVGDAVGLSLIFVPNERLADVLALIGQPEPQTHLPTEVGSVYEDVFIPDPPEDNEGTENAGA
jgi:transcriptional regulator with XRE-family HTH domain